MPARRPDQPPLDPLSLAVGERIATLRDVRGYAPSRLARLAGMDQNYLWRITAGRQNLSLRNIARLAVALDVSLSELFAGVDLEGMDLVPRSQSPTDPPGSDPQ